MTFAHFVSVLLDEAEFGEATINSEYDENTISPASDLGLMVGSQIKKLLR